MNLRYDRRVPKELLDVLDTGGFAHSLVQNARGGRNGADLQLRGYPGKTPHWVTFYIGAAKALELRYAGTRGFQLEADPFFKVSAHGWNPNWEQWHNEEKTAALWPAIDDYLDRAMARADKRFADRPGAVESAFSAYQSTSWSVIDREALLHYASPNEKAMVRSEMSKPFMAALDPPLKGNLAWWKTNTPLGNEVDALAISADGALLVVEIYGTKDLTATTWAPLQATHHANLFRRWIESDRDALEIVHAMLDQRVRLGLNADHGIEPAFPLLVRPMVVLGKPVVERGVDRLRLVQARLLERGVGDKDLTVWAANHSGRLTPIEL